MNFEQISGYLAATISAIIFLPQVIQTVKSKNTKSLSLTSFILLTVSNSFWIIYGILNLDTAIMLAQIFLFPMGLTILIYKIIYR